MRETKPANRPAPGPRRFPVETLAPAVRRLLGTPRRCREGEQGSREAATGAGGGGAAGYQEGGAEVRTAEGGRGAAALQRPLGRGGAVRRSRTRDAPLSQMYFGPLVGYLLIS